MAARGPVAAHRSAVGSRPTRLWGKPLGIMHVLITSQTAEHRLPKKPHQEMTGVLAASGLRRNVSARLGRPERVTELEAGKTPGDVKGPEPVSGGHGGKGDVTKSKAVCWSGVGIVLSSCCFFLVWYA